MGWDEKDGNAIAKLVYAELVKKGKLSINEILDVFDSYEHPVFRKTEWFISKALGEYKDVEKFVDEKGYQGLRLVKEEN